MRPIRPLLALALLATLVACDGGKKEAEADGTKADTAAKVEEEVKAEAKEAADAIKDEKKGRKKKDRGEGKATIGGIEWTADSAKAKIKEGKLTLKITNTDMSGGKVKRQELHLVVNDFKGAGEYTTPMHGSRFITVGMDSKKMMDAQKKDEAAGNDKETTKELVGSIADAGHIMIMGAKVNITDASDTEIKGTFVYESPQGAKKSMSDGSFRAIIPPPKK